jgi:hypothetical protein
MRNILRPKEIVEHLLELSTFDDPPSTIFVGEPATGKTTSIRDAAIKSKRVYYPLSLSRIEQYDIKGFPNIQGEYVRWVPPELIEAIVKSKGNIIVHFDEATLAKREVQDALLDLLQFKKVDDIQLPLNTMFVLSGNMGDDGTAAKAFSSAITGGRAQIYETTTPTLKEYLEYEQTIPNELRDFLLAKGIGIILQKPDPSHKFAPWSNPRAFSMVIQICNTLKINFKDSHSLSKFFKHSCSLLSPVTIVELEDWFNSMTINAEKLRKLDESEVTKYSKSESYVRSGALSEIARYCTGIIHEIQSSGESKTSFIKELTIFINGISRVEKDSEVLYAFLFAVAELDPNVSEQVKIGSQSLSDLYHSIISKMYKAKK